MDILSFGILVADMIIKPVTPDIFNRDATPVHFTTHPGGDGCNAMLNAAALGMKTALVSAVGQDAMSSFLLNHLSEHRVDTSWIRTLPDRSTGVSFVLTRPDGERHFLTCDGILDAIDPDWVTDEMLRQTKFLTINSYYGLREMEGPKGVALLQRAKACGARTALDTVELHKGQVMETLYDMLPYVDIFIPSFEEAEVIIGKQSPEEMAETMRPYGFDVFGVKLGGQGCFVTDYREAHYIPAAKIPQVVSTVGAGDTFFGGFLTAQIKGMGLRDSALFATAAAAQTVQVSGASGGVKSYEQVYEVYEELKRQG